MPQWTPGLEKAIRAYAEFEERSLARSETATPDMNLKQFFNMLNTQEYDHSMNGMPNLNIVCTALNLEVECSSANMKKMIEVAARNNSTAADPLKRILPVVIDEEAKMQPAVHPVAVTVGRRLDRSLN